MNKKGVVAAAAIIVVVLAIIVAISFYFDYSSAPKAQAPVVATSTPSGSQTVFAEQLIKDWTAISAKIPLKAGEGGKWLLDNIRVIGPTAAMVAFEDGLNGHVAIVSYGAGGYEIKKVYESQMQFTAAELTAIEKQYGDPAYAPQNFGRSEGDGSLISTENLFLKTSAATMSIKIAWLNPDGSMPNEVKPGDISGCDHVVLQSRVVPKTTTPLTSALNVLLSEKINATPGEKSLYNYVANGNLKLGSVSIVSGTAKIYLTGTPPALNGVCDDPRLFIQVTQTARQFPTVQKVQLFVNGVENTGSGNGQGI